MSTLYLMLARYTCSHSRDTSSARTRGSSSLRARARRRDALAFRISSCVARRADDRARGLAHRVAMSRTVIAFERQPTDAAERDATTNS